jgi:predicted MFS family arabinose efflux permease
LISVDFPAPLESPIKTPTRLDLPGAALLSLILVSFLLAISEGQNWGWGSGRTLGLLLVAVVTLAIWIPLELRVEEPLVDMRVLGQRTVAFTNATAFFAGFALFAAFVLVPRFVETSRSVGLDYGFGASATKAGLFLLPAALIGLVSGPFAGVLGARFGFKVPLALGMLLSTLGVVLLAEWHDRPWQVVLGATLAGGGTPLSFGAMAKIVVDSVRPSETGIATGLNTVMRTIGGVVGGQLAAAVLANSTIAGSSVPTGSAYSTAFWISAAVATCGIVTALAVTPHRGGGLEIAGARIRDNPRTRTPSPATHSKGE